MSQRSESSSKLLGKVSDPSVVKTLKKLAKDEKDDSPESRKTVRELEEMGLVSSGSITEHGVIVLWKIDELNKWLEEASATRKTERIEIDDYQDENSWANALIRFIDSSKKSLRITTIGYSSLEDPVWGKQFEDVLLKASERGVDISVLAARGFMSKNIVEFFSEIGHIELIDRTLLEKPPFTLPPIIKDFSHIAIADARNWLYLKPHEAPHKIEPRIHVGKVYMNSPLIARMIDDIFRILWTLSKGDGPAE